MGQLVDISDKDVVTGITEPEERLGVTKETHGTGQKELAPAF